MTTNSLCDDFLTLVRSSKYEFGWYFESCFLPAGWRAPRGFEPTVGGIPRRHFSNAVPENGSDSNQKERRSIPFRVLPSSLSFATEIDADLDRLIDVWSNPSEPIRLVILALV